MELSMSKYLQPFFANVMALGALVVWSFILGFHETRPSESVIQAARFQLEFAENFNEDFAYEQLMAKGDIGGARLESKRLAQWKEMFPWTPTIDSVVEFDPNIHLLSSTGSLASLKSVRFVDFAIARHNVALRRFFQKEVRFTRQFEQTYRVFAEFGRTNNPAYVADVFDSLVAYQQAAALAELHPHEIAMRYWVVSSARPNLDSDAFLLPTNRVERWKPFEPDFQTGKVMTWQERADYLNDKLLNSIHRHPIGK